MESTWVLLVIYQKNGADSAACRALRDMHYSSVLVVDNSREDFGNEAYCAEAGFAYLSMHGNAGLPKAYNRGIEWLKGRAEAVVLLDDDTTLSADFFEALRRAQTEHPEGRIFLPSVYDAVGLLSPCRVTSSGFARAEHPEDIPPACRSAINSGMAVDLRVFDGYRYDERYFLDFVDHAFLRDMRKRDVPIVLTGARLQQQFSGSSAYEAAAARARFALFRRDGAVYYGHGLRYVQAVLRRYLSLKRQALRH